MIYGNVIKSKTDKDIPLFTDGRSMHSKYNPEKEAQTFCQSSSPFFNIVFGIGGGFHLRALLSLYPDVSLIAVEADDESLVFCLELEENKILKGNSNLHFCTVKSLAQNIREFYLPSLYGNLNVMYWRSWQVFNQNLVPVMEGNIKEGISEVSADFSVQSHFGKLWHKNILLNLKSLKDNKLDKKIDTGLTASIIAAGPSLDESINRLKENRSNTIIFSTDTAYGPLMKNNIVPDFVVSVDSQRVSLTHFMTLPFEGPKPVFILDISCPLSLSAMLYERGYPVFFITTGHPLSVLAKDYMNLPCLYSGAGTVTIASLDFARYLGFTRFILYGADFSYNSGKAYARGTYLDNNFSLESSRIDNSETRFDSLMFRTELSEGKDDNPFTPGLRRRKTTQTMKRYEKTTLDWVLKHDGKVKDYIIYVPLSQREVSVPFTFSYETFIEEYLKNLETLYSQGPVEKNKYLFASLPYISWCRKYIKDKENPALKDLLQKTYRQTVRYNKENEIIKK